MFSGLSSPYWYTSEAFYELVNAANMPTDTFVSLFCDRRKATDILKRLEHEAGTLLSSTDQFTFADTELLLKVMRDQIRTPVPQKLGKLETVLCIWSTLKGRGILDELRAREFQCTNPCSSRSLGWHS